MRRRLALGVLLGWLLGIGTALALPDFLYQRQTISLAGPGRAPFSRIVEATTQEGWRVVRIDNDVLYQLERPRYLSVAEAIASLRRPSASAPTPAPPKPTEAPKPAAPPAR